MEQSVSMSAANPLLEALTGIEFALPSSGATGPLPAVTPGAGISMPTGAGTSMPTNSMLAALKVDGSFASLEMQTPARAMHGASSLLSSASPFSGGASRQEPESAGSELAIREAPTSAPKEAFSSSEPPAVRAGEFEAPERPTGMDERSIALLRQGASAPASDFADANDIAKAKQVALLLELLPKRVLLLWPKCSDLAADPVHVLVSRLKRFGNSFGRKLTDARLYLQNYGEFAKAAAVRRGGPQAERYLKGDFFPISSAEAEVARQHFYDAGLPTAGDRVDPAHEFLVKLGMGGTDPPLLEPMKDEHKNGPSVRYAPAGEARVAPPPWLVVCVYGIAADPPGCSEFLGFAAASNAFKGNLSARGAAMSQGGVARWSMGEAAGRELDAVQFAVITGLPDALAADKLGKVGNKLYAPLLDVNTGTTAVWAESYLTLCEKMGPRTCTPDCVQSTSHVLKPDAPLDFKPNPSGANGGYAYMAPKRRAALNSRLLELAAQGFATPAELQAAKWSGEYCMRHLHPILAELACWSGRALAILGDWALQVADKKAGGKRKSDKAPASTGKRVYAAEFSPQLQSHARATMLLMIHHMLRLWFSEGAPGRAMQDPQEKRPDHWQPRAYALFHDQSSWETLMEHAMASQPFVTRFYRYDGGPFSSHFRVVSDLGPERALLQSASGAEGAASSSTALVPAAAPAAAAAKKAKKGAASGAKAGDGGKLPIPPPLGDEPPPTVVAAQVGGLRLLSAPTPGGTAYFLAPMPRPQGRCTDTTRIAGRLRYRESSISP